MGRVSAEQRERAFATLLLLGRTEAAFALAAQLDRSYVWRALARKALEALDVEVALRVYRQLGDAPMVLALSQLRSVEDRLLLAGHLAAMDGRADAAQDLFLRSAYPEAALELRCDLLQVRGRGGVVG